MFHEVWEFERFRTAKVTYSVIQGHWQCCHSIGHIRFTIVPLQLCTIIEILSLISWNLKRSRDITHPVRGWYIMLTLVLLCINQQTKFEVPSFTISKDMIRAKLKLMGQMTLTPPLLEWFVILKLGYEWYSYYYVVAYFKDILFT